MASGLPGVEFEAYGRIASRMWVIKEKTGKNRKNRQNPDFHCLFFGQPSNWVALFFFKSDGLLVLLCQKYFRSKSIPGSIK
jgi:hypothetical protein